MLSESKRAIILALVTKGARVFIASLELAALNEMVDPNEAVGPMQYSPLWPH